MKNRAELLEARAERALAIREANNIKMQENFMTAQATEIKVVEVYSKKIIELVNELDGLDVTEQDDQGFYVNMGPYATIVMGINKTHEMMSKLSGTESARAVMEHMRKAYAKEVAAKASGMHDAAQKMETIFHDDVETMKEYGPCGLPDLKKIN